MILRKGIEPGAGSTPPPPPLRLDPSWPVNESHRGGYEEGEEEEEGVGGGGEAGRSVHRGGKQRRDSTGQPEQTGVVSTSPLTNCDTTSCHTRLNSAEARSRSTGNKLMFARRIWVVWRFSGDTYSKVGRARIHGQTYR